METDKLKHFCTIADCGSLSQAALILGVSHSTLSKSINKLQQELGFKVFRAQGRGLEITEQGLAIYSKAASIVSATADLKVVPCTIQKPLKIFMPELLAQYFAAPILQVIKQPLSLLSQKQMASGTEIEEQNFDFGFAFSMGISPIKAFEFLKIGRVEFNVFGLSKTMEALLNNERFVAPLGKIYSSLGDYIYPDAWPNHLQRNIFCHAASFKVAMEVAKAGHALIYAPDFAIQIENKSGFDGKLLQVAKFNKARKYETLFLLKKKSEEETAIMKKVSSLIRKYLKSI
ncbi:MAG: LysR family transcriptional regulator [Oligoflexales bacterium]|nr:LysR family transcriptional regulator [Oligoflexales bacterium]